MFGTNVLRKQVDGDGTKLWVQSFFHTIQGEGPFGGRPAVFLRLSGCNLACYFCDTDFESKRREMTVEAIAKEIVSLSVGAPESIGKRTNLVVITGGEPLLQNITPLCLELCYKYHLEVQLETAGTVWQDGLERMIHSGMLTIVCSPKTGRVHTKIQEHCHDWKYLIKEGCVSPDGLPSMSTQVEGKELKLYRPAAARPYDVIWLQPCEVYKVNYKKVGFHNDGTKALDHLKGQPLADQEVTSSARDEAGTRRNIELCAKLAMQHNYRVSVQLHKILGLP